MKQQKTSKQQTPKRSPQNSALQKKNTISQQNKQKNEKMDLIKQSHEEKAAQRKDELDNLKKNLMKKLYMDLYTQNVSFFTEKDLTFENFLFKFYKMIEETIDFVNPNYPLLLRKIDLKIKAKYEEENILTPDLNKIEIKKNVNKLSQDDEWALIYKYQTALYNEQKKKEEEKRIKDKEKYFSELDQQIYQKKNFIDPIQKQKDEIYLFQKKEAMEEFRKLKLQNQMKIDQIKLKSKNDNKIKPEYIRDLEEMNVDLTDDNKDLVGFKINYLLGLPKECNCNVCEKGCHCNCEDGCHLIEHDGYKKCQCNVMDDGLLGALVDQIMCEKKLEKAKGYLNTFNYQRDLEKQMSDNIKNSYRPDKMSVEERKFNKDLLEASKRYFQTHNY